MKTLLGRICAVLAALVAASSALATPTISITSPTSGSTIGSIDSPAGFTISANAAPTAGASIVSVQFFDNGVSIGTVGGTSPFSITWSPTSAGTHTLTATVTDNSVPTTGTSPSVTTATATSIVNVTRVRVVNLSTSVSTSNVAQGSQIFLRALPALSDAVVARVEFRVDGVLIDSRTQAPYNLPVTLAAPNFPVGARSLTATVFNSDDTISATSAPLTLNVATPVSGDAPPTVSIAAPANGANVQVGGNVTLTANASDVAPGFIPSGAGGGVIFLVDGDPVTPIGTGETNPDLVAPYSITWRPTVTKTYSLRAQTVDDKNNVVLSPEVLVNAFGSLPTPTVALTAPTAGSSVLLNSNVTVTANATGTGGATVAKVDFFAGGTLIGTATTAPYSIVWPATPVGAVALTARVTDSNGTAQTSAATNVTVATSINLPTVALTSPSPGRIVSVGTPVALSANANAFGGATVAAVEFLVGMQVVASATSPAAGSTYSATWTPTSTGSAVVTARVIDSTGAQVTSSPSVTVTVAAAPTVAITAPTASSVQSSNPFPITASATAGTGLSIASVQFFANGTSIGTANSAPFSITWNPSTSGAVTLTARATDSGGGIVNSAPVSITVSGGPSVVLTSPSAGNSAQAGTAVALAATATASGSTIARVEFLVDGVIVATDTTSPYSATWTPSTIGSVTLSARAVDSAGGQGVSPGIVFQVGDPAVPTLALTLSPSTSTTLPEGSSRFVVATATPASGRAIANVEFFLDGQSVAVRNTAPYSYRFTAAASSGTSTLLVRATDNGGLTTEQDITFTMVAAVGEKPTVSMIGPAANTTVLPNSQVNLVATANDPDGSIASVQFYARGQPAGAADTSSPYTGSFTPSTPGTYVLEAVATDDQGNTTTSNAVTLTAAFATPTVAITAPSPSATARATPNVPLNLQVNAVGGGGAGVLLVEFLLDDVPIGTASAPTNGAYRFAFTPTVAQLGPHRINARVTDNNSQTATSAPLNIIVANAVGTPPNISITQPTTGGGAGQQGNLQSLSTVNFVANASSPTGGVTIQSVEFFLNDASIGTGVRQAPNSNLWRLAYDFGRIDFSTIAQDTNGRYALPFYAIARDSNGNQTATNPITLTVNPATSAPPSVQILANSGTTITQGQQFLMLMQFADNDGTVTQLQVFANGAPSGAAVSNPQPNQTLTFTPPAAGSYTVVVVATDDTGNTAVTAPVTVTVTAIAAPTTALTRPADDSTTATVNSPVFLEGTAASSVPTQVPTLNFVAQAPGAATVNIPGQRVGTTNTYRAIWTPTLPGTYTLTTQATIAGIAPTPSATSRRVIVTNLQGLAPTVTISTNGSATTASQLNLTANATDSDGSVVEVEFFVNRNSVGEAVRDDSANTWRLTTSLAGLPLGNAEIVALARDSSGNVAASPTTTISISAASSIAPSITIEPSTTNAAFNRQVQLRATARDSDTNGAVTSVQYFANGTSLGTSGNAGTNFQVNWTPNQSGTFNIWAVATDNTNITTVSPTVRVTVRRNNPVLEDAAFILQTYQDIANTTTINPIVFDTLDSQLAAGSLSRADLVMTLVDETGFVPPVNLLAAYHVLMGQWPTPANYNALIGTARGSLPNAIGAILSSNEYLAKYGLLTAPTVAQLNNPASVIPADTFIARLWQGAGRGSPSALENTQFRNNNVLTPTLGRGYNAAGVGLNTAIAEFITNTNSTNTALFNRARAAALYYQLIRPAVGVTVEQITARIDQLIQLADMKAMADSLVTDTLYRYRYVTITRHPSSLVVAARSGALFSVEADGAPPLAYQWLLNGAPIPGATNALLSLTNVDATRVGSYTAVVTSSAGSSTSDAATLTLSTTPTRLANISTRGVTSGGASVMIGGFVVSGTSANQTRQMLIRVVGPRLAQAPFNLTGVLADPRLEVYRSGTANPILSNDNWGTQAAAQVTAIQQATTRAGAFALGANSADAVVLATLAPGLYTVMAHPPVNNPSASGVVLIEVYDVTQGGAAGPKASNVSTRGQVGTGSNVMIAGFVVDGAVSRRMLIRGAGPTLASLGVPGVINDPQLTLVNQSNGQTVRTNDNWASGDDAAVIAQAATAAGAFSFANGSRDAAMLVMLPPGAYTVQLSGVGSTTGIGIVEVYDVDP
jgi:hypothetical protein